MRKVVLYIAISLDGYVADKNGGVDWLGGDDSEPQNFGTYNDFINGIDTVIIGYNTYNQIVTQLSPDSWVYSGMKSYVLTNRSLDSNDEITFTNEDLRTLISRLKEQNGKDIWICGGASIFNQLIRENLIDRFRIAIMPTILGDGIPLFEKHLQSKMLKLIDSYTYNGITEVVYERR